VIAGARTASGKPILANDPHLGLHAPVLWYLARIDTPDLWIKGATVPGMPMVLLGQNSHFAWGLTTTDSDTQDLFIETVDPADPGRYLTPTGPQPFAVRVETIHVKGAADDILRVRSTRHGPVVSDVDGEVAGVAGAGRVIALQFTALDGRDTTAEALVRLNRARDWDSFLDALHPYVAPPQNFVYADTAGHIGFVNAGRVPARHEGEGLVPVDGARDGHEWERMVPFAALPQVRDPPAGFIFNANNAVTDRTTPYFFGIDWEEPYRAQRLQHFFDTIARHSLETAAAMQMDIVSPVAQQLLPHLLRQRPDSPRAAAALSLLKNWDGAMDQARPEPLIFEAWLYEMHRKLLVEKAGLPLEAKGPYFATAIAAILEADDRDWCGANGCAPIITAAFGDALAMLQARLGEDMAKWTWGREHVSRLDNIFFSHVPVLSTLTDLSVPSSGGFYTLDRGEGWSADPREPFARRNAAGYRAIYDLGDPDASRFVIATGESAHVFSRHYGDMVPLWNSGRYVTLAGTRETLAARHLPQLDFVPAPARTD
jgi:penicillin amidase